MSNKRQNSSRTAFVKLKRCDVTALIPVVVLLAAILPATIVECAKLDAHMKLLINDDDLLMEQQQWPPIQAEAAEQTEVGREANGNAEHGAGVAHESMQAAGPQHGRETLPEVGSQNSGRESGREGMPGAGQNERTDGYDSRDPGPEGIREVGRDADNKAGPDVMRETSQETTLEDGREASQESAGGTMKKTGNDTGRGSGQKGGTKSGRSGRQGGPELRLKVGRDAGRKVGHASVRDTLRGAAAAEHERFNLYRSELKRLSYETIHRILRDENEPIYRREDSELRYYQKRSYQPTHEVVRRSTPVIEMPPPPPPPKHFVIATRQNLSEYSVVKNFKGLPNLITAVDLSGNKLQQLNLTEFTELQILNLSNNLFSSLPLVVNSTLLSLQLNGNHIRTGLAPANYRLRELHLSSNEIENLSALNLSLLNALETLDLSCNRIENLETAFFPQRMRNLRHLNLAHNRLGSIYRETFYNLLSLNTLLLRGNNISDIDYETFLALPNLQYLDLSYNQLKGESIRALQGIPDLVGLSIAYNPEVGASMQEFVASWSLKELDASGTGLCQIPAALAQSVRTLKLTDNWLKVINCGDLDSYPLLQYLDLSNSRIDDIEDDALGRLEILEVLFLDHNNLRKVPISLPTSIEHLFLQHNQIMDIQVQAFQGLNNLQTLDLSRNKLLYLPALPLPKLLTLNLQSSGLKGVSQAIVHTLPRLRDLLLEENPIKCSDLLGIAEWASPCRMVERSNNAPVEADDNRDGEQTANADVGQREQGEQQQLAAASATKIDLKQKFVQMHNFYEKFKSNCVLTRQMIPTGGATQTAQTAPQTPPPPTCASDTDAEVDNASEAATATTANMNAAESNENTRVISFNLPSEPVKDANANPNGNGNGNTAGEAKVSTAKQKNLTTKITGTFPASAHIPADAGVAAPTKTTVNTLNNNAAKGSSNLTKTGKVRKVATAKTLSEYEATTTRTEPQSTETPSTVSTTTTDAAATTRTVSTAKKTNATATPEHANQNELKTRRMSESFVKDVGVFTTTTTSAATATAAATTAPTATGTTAAVNSEKQETGTATPAPPKQTPASSSNNNEGIAKLENVDTATEHPTIQTTPTTGRGLTTSTKSAPTRMHVPQTISTAIKSGNNYVETGSLLSQKGFKTSAATAETIKATTTTTPTTTTTTPTATEEDKDLAQNDSNEHNKVVEYKQQNNFKRAYTNFNGISGQQQQSIGWEPTTAAENRVLASQQQPTESLPTDVPAQTPAAGAEPTTATTLPHKHEPLQLHIKDRHLIGTPLLMNKGQNILVEAEQLMLAAGPTATSTAPGAAIKTVTTSAYDVQTGKGNKNEADILARSQHPSAEVAEPKWPRDITGLGEPDKTLRTEVINEKTNEENGDTEADHAKLAATHDADKQAVDETEKEAKKATAPVDEPAKPKHAKKKPSLIMKKMTITTKHATNAQKQPHHALNTPRDNEAVVQHFEAGLFHELKPANEPEVSPVKPSTQHKHSMVNTPLHAYNQLQELSTFAQQHVAEPPLSAPAQEPVTKSEQWLDTRKTIPNGHPGLVILLSCSLFVVLLIGLMHVYRCDMPWRRHLTQQRPHQRQLNEDDAHSFLHYQSSSQQQSQPPPTLQKWHHSARRQPPYTSPLHSLHVRELQKTSAVDEKANRCKQFYGPYLGSAANSRTNSSDGSHSSSLGSSHSSAIMDGDNFYIEMTPDSGQPAGTFHSDLLPMELLNVSHSRRAGDGEMDALNGLTTDKSSTAVAVAAAAASTANTKNIPTTTATTTITVGDFGLLNGETSADDGGHAAPGTPAVAPKPATSTRKFGLW